MAYTIPMMNLHTILQKFPTQADCLVELERIRWGDTPACTYCKSENVRKRKKEQVVLQQMSAFI